MQFQRNAHSTCVRIFTILGLAVNCSAQSDPGPRGGQPSAGGSYPTLNTIEQAVFYQASLIFQEVDSVSGSINGEPGTGLGPAFNGNSCAMCHSQPAVGGSSPGFKSPQKPVPNPQVALATLHGATNVMPSFVSSGGPVREARLVTGPSGPDGGVYGLFTIAGRSDASGCNLAQPDFASQLSGNNVIFRIPTPTFGLGLAENTPDAALRSNLAANQAQKAALGIAGVLNTSGNDGTVTRFGWKAQNKSLLIFSGEAYNVEIGVSNEAFPNKRSAIAGCVYNPTPEDTTNIAGRKTPTGSSPGGLNFGSLSAAEMIAKVSSDITNFALFMRLSAPPQPASPTPSTQNGATQFNNVGCALCHSTSLTTAASPYTGMSSVAYHPYSDFALHHMGSGLSDGVTQGAAGPDQFRTAPLWGLGQRLYFLHDGRTEDLMQAIQAHSSPGSEANAVVVNFNALSSSAKQDVLNFLRSL